MDLIRLWTISSFLAISEIWLSWILAISVLYFMILSSCLLMVRDYCSTFFFIIFFSSTTCLLYFTTSFLLAGN